MVIAAGLSIQDPRERPTGQEQRAGRAPRPVRGCRARTSSATSRLWDHVKERQRSCRRRGSGGMCKDELLHFLRLREWQDVYTPDPPGRAQPEASASTGSPPMPMPSTGRCWPACSPHVGAASDEGPRGRAAGRVPRPPQRPLRARPGIGAGEEARPAGSWWPSSSRPTSSGPAPAPASSRRGSSRRPRTCSPAPTTSRTGTRDRGAAQAIERVTLCGPSPSSSGRAHQPRPRRPGPWPASCSSSTPWSDGDWDAHHPFVGAQRSADRRGPLHGGPRPPARHPRQRGPGVRRLRPAHPRARDRRPPLRALVARRGRAGPAPARPHRGRPDRRRQHRRRRRRLPRPLGRRARRDPHRLRVRAGPRLGRHHVRGAGRRAQPDRPRAVRVAGPRPAPRARRPA